MPRPQCSLRCEHLSHRG
ncbi:unnamed protein product [Linum tenue]|uniref:Uncharacterized protein n=1 Tax=Linum tenue TaxID=586396 RepID=A0AAV0K4T8_9ROSI|nr:unnamed protein product [Linum tenue]CAI0416083.1 unnamed protein product [Linum tenue]CAI0428156.1 unnamed protein product [Linum tenue]CAI0561051.1 unnamed protein product [Linum tenue]CAI0628162.1 unnamed protein product [Linum tenue]